MRFNKHRRIKKDKYLKKFIINYIVKEKSKQRIIKANNLYEARMIALKSHFEIISIEEYFGAVKYKFKDEDLIFILKDLNMMLKAGLSLQEAILEFSRSNYEKQVAQIFNIIYQKLSNGSTYDQAFANVLSVRECAILKICEGKGDLHQAFGIIIDLKEKHLRNLKQFKKAMAYPSFVFACIILAFVVLMVLVLPEFKNLFAQLELDLPQITQILFHIGDFFNQYYIYFAILLLCFIFAVYLSRKALYFHKLLFYLPIFGKIMLYQEQFCFFLVFSYLSKSGVDVKRAFGLACESIRNSFFKNTMYAVKTSFESGLSMDQAFFKTKFFEPFVIRMLKLALKSSKLDESTYELAVFYEYKKESYTQKFFSLLEPLMTVFMAILILILALGVFLPMWQINQAF
ncbi:hypothetical protein CKA54_02260 [Campylobacter sp. P255]|nr:hypothetical protein CKA54_02260 [Campylobacter sp. P255]